MISENQSTSLNKKLIITDTEIEKVNEIRFLCIVIYNKQCLTSSI